MFAWSLQLRTQRAHPQLAQHAAQHEHAASVVQPRLLGPFVAAAGQPLTLAWQLTRVQSGGGLGASPKSASVAHHEGSGAAVAADADGPAHEGPLTQEELLSYDVLQPSVAEQDVCAAQQQAQHAQQGMHTLLPPWRLSTCTRGVVRLGVQAGAVAVVEVEVEPALVGVLPPPQLSFRGGVRTLGTAAPSLGIHVS